MAMTPEKRVKDKIVVTLKEEDIYYFFPATGGYGRSGVPDIIACVNGQFVGIECKAKGNKPTALQVRELEGIRRRGGVAIIVDEHNLDMVPELIRKLKRRTIIGVGA
jgi:Holliday junction resolvase